MNFLLFQRLLVMYTCNLSTCNVLECSREGQVAFSMEMKKYTNAVRFHFWTLLLFMFGFMLMKRLLREYLRTWQVLHKVHGWWNLFYWQNEQWAWWKEGVFNLFKFEFSFVYSSTRIMILNSNPSRGVCTFNILTCNQKGLNFE